VHRDFDRNGIRTGDKLDTGFFGINQHHANDAPRHDIGKWGAGCLVGRTVAAHDKFMNLIMQDRRYKLNKNHIFGQPLFQETIWSSSSLVYSFARYQGC
jgi:hypothetical protein